MAETKTKQQTTMPPVQEAPQLPATAQAPKADRKEAWEGFRDELEKRATEIGSQLPSNVSREKFMNATIAAVKQNPEILTATPRSLFSAITKSAQDGLLADGREGIITVYRQKIPNSKPEQHEIVAQWNPMFYGIRKRAREIDGIIIDAQVVYVGDEFEYELGDAPFIKHKPKPRGEKVDASAGVAVYAIFRDADQRILHREVMWKFDVFDVMNQSRNKAGLMWTLFWTEGWRKTCGRRGAKTVPMSPQLERLITREDADFSFDREPPKMLEPPPEPPTPPEPKKPATIISGTSTEGEKIKRPDIDDQADAILGKGGLHNSDQPAGGKNEATDVIEGSDPDDDISPTDFLTQLDAELSIAADEATLLEIWEREDAPGKLDGTPFAEDADKIYDRHMSRIHTKTRTDLEDAGQQGFGFETEQQDDDSFPGDR